ncbi:putative calcium-transporting ATPase 13, plasma membrane-type [Camellia lanceoleosa]|uniref:Calcium-transporting ATPase 13, plasma membrane-type n=1 Tax=Camellia lanceoleosa TaxID=1840588 RepID=A0ACC0GF88_9ERIC|nr:putative calcium-transporting ATPase 13, plasma membrane-type [Camellia lanceoleosa]
MQRNYHTSSRIEETSFFNGRLTPILGFFEVGTETRYSEARMYIIVEVKELNFDEEGCGVLMRKDLESVNSSYWKGSASTILAIKSMEDCIGAGVNIKLVSGCDASELESIALEYRLYIPNSDSVVLGENFRNSTPEVRMEMVDQICVMASSLPSDKLLLVKCLEEKGQIVAMVGARTDETPAIKEANVRITMGSGSTEMARESSNIIIWNGDFNSLFTIMKCG